MKPSTFARAFIALIIGLILVTTPSSTLTALVTAGVWFLIVIGGSIAAFVVVMAALGQFDDDPLGR